MADLDKLDIIIRAQTGEAITAIDKLIDKLGALGGAFDVKGIDGFSKSLENVASAINSIKSDNLQALSTAMASFTKSTKGLANVSKNATKGGDAVGRLTKKLADIANIKDKTGISMLNTSLDQFLHATSGEEMSAARNRIMTIAKTFGVVGSELSEDRKKAQEFLNELSRAKINLPLDWTKEYADSEEGKRIRGKIGISNTVSSGGSDAEEVAARLGLGEYNNAQDAFKALAAAADGAREIIRMTDEDMSTLGDALGGTGEQAREAAESMQAFTQALANAVGLTSNQLSGVGGGDGFLGDGFEQQNIAMETFTQNAERLLQVGNPFQNIADGLNEITNLTPDQSIVDYLNNVTGAIRSIGGKAGQNAGVAMIGIADGIRALDVPIPETGEQIANFAKSLRMLGSGNMTKAAEALPFIAMGLNQLSNVKVDSDAEKIAELAKAVGGFGYAKVEKSIQNLPVLTQELTRLITALSQAPEVSANTVELVKALGAMNVNARALTPNTRKAGTALDFFSKKANRAKKSSFSLAAAIGKIYASYWMVMRGIGMFKNSIDLASDLTEVQNVVDQTFGQMKYAMEDFATTAVETVGMSELTAKKIGSRYQGMARAMAITPEMMRNASDFTDRVTNGYASASDSVADMSINLTKLAGDMASFYNLDYEDVAEDLEAVMTGMTRPLRKYGIDLTVASMKEFALANGLNADIKNMSQAEKTMLRYQMVMARTTAAQGDFIRTQDTWANQTRIAGENLKRLQIILGQIGIYSFKPLVKSFNLAMNDILHLAESTFNSLGKIFGWQIEVTDVGILDDYADGLEDVSDGYGDASDSAKKFKNFLLGIDELNLLPDDKNKGDDSGAGDALGAYANGLEDSMVKMVPVEKGFESIYDTLFKLGKRINEVSLDFLKGIDWDAAYVNAEKAGKGLAEFLNGYFSDAELFYHKGRAIANGLNTVAHAIYGFFHEFDGYQFGKDLGFEINGITRNLDWDIIKSATYEMSHDITEFINGAIENTNWKDVGRTLAEGFNTAILFVSTFWNEIHWDQLGVAAGDLINSFFLNFDEEEAARMVKGKLQAVLDFANNLLSTADFAMIGEKIGKFLAELNLSDYIDDVALLVWNLIKAAFSMLGEMSEEAPLETALIEAFILFKFAGFGNVIGGNMATAVAGSFLSQLKSLLFMDLVEVSASFGIAAGAAMTGAAIAAGILTALKGVDWGTRIGEIIFPDDAMWYQEFRNSWNDIIKRAFDNNFTINSTFSMDNNTQGHQKDWLTGSGISIHTTSGGGGARDDGSHNSGGGARDGDVDQIEYVTNEYKKAKAEAEEKLQELMNIPLTQYDNNINNWINSNDRIRLALINGSMTIDDVIEHYSNLGHATVYVRKPIEETAKKVKEYTKTVKDSVEAGKDWERVMSISAASGNRIGEAAKKVAELQANIFSSQKSMEKLNSTFEESSKQDKSAGFNQTFDLVKERMSDIGSMFSMENMNGMLSTVPKAFKAAWGDALNIMRSMLAEMANWINTNALIEIPKVKLGEKEFGGQTMRVKVSKFDVGGSIPNNGSLFIANEKGPEVMANMGSRTGIMNTDQMEAAIANGMAKALANGGQNVTVVLEGNAADFFNAMVKENNNAIMRVGASPLRV